MKRRACGCERVVGESNPNPSGSWFNDEVVSSAFRCSLLILLPFSFFQTFFSLKFEGMSKSDSHNPNNFKMQTPFFFSFFPFSLYQCLSSLCYLQQFSLFFLILFAYGNTSYMPSFLINPAECVRNDTHLLDLILFHAKPEKEKEKFQFNYIHFFLRPPASSTHNNV